MKKITIDRATASGINPVIGLVGTVDTLAGARDILEGVAALAVDSDDGINGPPHALALILTTVSAALNYEIENSLIQQQAPPLTPIAA